MKKEEMKIQTKEPSKIKGKGARRTSKNREKMTNEKLRAAILNSYRL